VNKIEGKQIEQDKMRRTKEKDEWDEDSGIEDKSVEDIGWEGEDAKDKCLNDTMQRTKVEGRGI